MIEKVCNACGSNADNLYHLNPTDQNICASCAIKLDKTLSKENLSESVCQLCGFLSSHAYENEYCNCCFDWIEREG